jgi:peptidoglycan/xylan/chitin deacetylase (PgdA/CDA1 family)
LSYSSLTQALTSWIAPVVWRTPGRFRLAGALGPYSLRCVVFHDVSESVSAFTAGINATITPRKFADALRFLKTHYVPVGLDDVLNDVEGHQLPERAVLVTFDDAYASVLKWAAPLCKEMDVPAIFFVNAAFLGNRHLAPDNLVCYVANTLGMSRVREALKSADLGVAIELDSLRDVFNGLFPSLSIGQREAFLCALRRAAGVNDGALAKEAGLYLSGEDLKRLISFGFEIGNHTYTHVHGRLLAGEDFSTEIDGNKAELERASGTKIRAFSQPYGSSRDVTSELVDHLSRTGHQAAFLSQSVANTSRTSRFQLDRVSTRAESNAQFFFELEILPRLRAKRNKLRRRSQTITTEQAVSTAKATPAVGSNYGGKVGHNALDH